MAPADPTLWHGALEKIERHMIISSPHPIDNDIVKAVFFELVLIGERPPAEEVARFLKQRWPKSSDDLRRRSLTVWKKLERNPVHRFKWEGRGYPVLPFVTLDQVVEAHGLQPVGERLSLRINRVNEDLLALTGPPFDLDSAARLDRELLTLQNALRVYVANRSDTGLKRRDYGLSVPLKPSFIFERTPYDHD
jgi:hypothetical protein